MALNIAAPYIHVEDANGLPYVGAKLYVYLPGTTTLASIYSDEALTVPLTNPLTGVNASDAAGNFPRAYIAAGTYKIRAVTSADVLIWQHDNIDTGLPASTGALPISRGGTGAPTAAGARTSLDVPSNSELADLADSIADIQSSLQNIVSFPQGRLTLTSGAPVLASGVTAGTAVYYTPYVGNLIPIYDGSQFGVSSFAELTLTLNSNHVANAIYDAYVFSDSGTVTIGTGPAWNTATAGAGARGSGAGTTQLVRTNGLWTNAVAITARNGATTYSVPASRGTYIGSLLMDGTNGQITCHTTWGQSRKWGVWNAFNRVQIILQGGDATASWLYNSATIRQSNGAAGNTIALFAGLAEVIANANFKQKVQPATSSAIVQSYIGVNSTTVASDVSIPLGMDASGGSQAFGPAVAECVVQPSLGLNAINMLENAPSAVGASSQKWFGGASNMMMTVTYMG